MNQLITITTNENDEQLVSGRELHKFLGIETKYEDWFPRMAEYGFTESIDYHALKIENVVNNRTYYKTDHAMKLDMAKEVSMIQRNEKGKQARQYFIEVEKRYKQEQLDTSNLSPELQMFNGLFKSLAKQELATKQLESKVDSISEIVAVNTVDWRKDTRQLINAVAKTQGGFSAYQEIQSEIYTELERRASCKLSIRLTNKRNVMAGEGVSKSKRDKLNKVDVISDDKKLVEIYMAIVKEFAIKAGVWNVTI